MSLRAKLILSYACIIALCLGLTALASAILLDRTQRDLSARRLADIAEPVALILHEHNDPASLDAAALLTKEADQTGTRMLVLGARVRRDLSPPVRAGAPPPEGIVLQDTAELLPPGTTLRLPSEVFARWNEANPPPVSGRGTPTLAPSPTATAALPRLNAQLALPKPYQGRLAIADGSPVDVAAVPLRAERAAPGFRVLVVVEGAGQAEHPLARLVVPLTLVAGGAFLISILLALVLARSITRPLVALTAATRALARGDYSRRVPVAGGEVGELATSFNTMAAEIERARRHERDFLANISHDLKTPLTSIQGFAGALADGTCPPDQYPAAARIIHEEARRMGDLVGEVLQLSRLQAGDAPLLPTPIDLGELLRATARRFGPAVAAAEVTLRVTMPDPLAAPISFEADRARLEQLLANLLDNALRHTPPGGTIVLAGSLAAACPPQVEIAVRDTGAGISAEDLPRVFERFYQADKARSGRRGAGGLGLAIVRELVELHGGTVHAASTVGAGTVITVCLPVHQNTPVRRSLPV